MPLSRRAVEKQARSDSARPVNTTLYEVNIEGCQGSNRRREKSQVAKLNRVSCFIITLNICICIHKTKFKATTFWWKFI